jgi:hypothetical protein
MAAKAQRRFGASVEHKVAAALWTLSMHQRL